MKIETIIRLSQKELKRELANAIKKLGYTPVNQKGFLYAKGQIPVLLVAHLDTVHIKTPSIICYSQEKRILMSPQGIGGDDRAGIYMILEIIKTHKCHVLFTEDEEIGGIGANHFIKSKIKPDVNFIIELDRKGSNDAVYYDDCNEKFEKFINSFGFKTDYGSFSDISVIAPALGISAVNLSAGYFNAHTLHEYIDLKVIKENIQRVKAIVSANTERFVYTQGSYYEEKLLMPVNDGYIKFHNGEITEGFNYYIDESNRVYEYDYLYDCASEVDARAFNGNGINLRFKLNKSEFICVI